MRPLKRALLLPALLGACVSLPPERLELAHNPAGGLTSGFGDPGPPRHLEPSRRFLVKAGDFVTAKRVSRLAEQDYERLMAHTGLFSFKPSGLYPIVVYKDSAEYLAKTSAPSWSGGIAAGNAVYTFEGPELRRTLAHEIVHLIFHDYMGGAGRLRWFNEGLAVYEESQVLEGAAKREIEEWMRSSRLRPMPFSRLVSYEPGGPETRAWYGQSASLVRYLVEVGGRGGVERFLEASRDGAGLDAALAAGFPARFTGLSELEKRWLQVKE